MVFNNEQATFEEQTAENLKYCLNAVMVHAFLSIWHIMHNPRHVSACKQIARVIKLNNCLSEFPTPAGVKARKIDGEIFY
eukprot:801076-Ditylum_brightwellii.AAC.1